MDNKEVNNIFLKKANITYNKISTFFPTLNYITINNKTFNI